jgi:hypothetical protein
MTIPTFRTIEKDFDQEAGDLANWLVGGDEDGENILAAFRSTESDEWWVALTHHTGVFAVHSDHTGMDLLRKWSELIAVLSECPDWTQENMNELLVLLEYPNHPAR